jgi:hypothetical protein
MFSSSNKYQTLKILTNSFGKAKASRKMGDETVKNDALQIIGMFQVLPRLVVFDLDYTLWPFYWYLSFFTATCMLT